MELSILTHPDFGEVRTTYDENGTILFCATDVAKTLGYTNPTKAIRDHCTKDGGTIRSVIDNLGRKQETKFIYEPNLYRLIAKSKLPFATAFEKWIFETVIPNVRKNGFYANKDLINDPDFLSNWA